MCKIKKIDLMVYPMKVLAPDKQRLRSCYELNANKNVSIAVKSQKNHTSDRSERVLSHE